MSAGSRFDPFRIGERWRVVPPGVPVERFGGHDLIVARGAFGSGEHETTASCLEEIESLHGLDGATVLDLGCGTGILAVAALVLGAGQAVCVDVSVAAVAATRRNCELNGVGDRSMLIAGTLDAVAAAGFDVVLANIYGDLLVDLAAAVVGRCSPGVRLVLSGILWEHSYDVRTRYARLGCRVISNRMLEEYCTLVLEGPS